MEEASPGERLHLRFVLACAVVLSLALIAAVFSVPFLPTNDGPQAIYSAWVRNHYLDPGSDIPRYLGVHEPLTWAGFSWVFRFFEKLFPWRTALQLVLCLWGLTWSWGFLALTHTLSPRRTALGLLGFAAAFQWSYYMGLYCFLLSLSLGFWILVLALRSPTPWSNPRTIAVALLLYLQARIHVMGAELTGFVLLFLALRAWPWAQFFRLALAGIPALVVAIQTALAAPAIAATLNTHTIWPSFYDGFRLLGRAFVSGPWWRSYPPVLLAVLSLALSIRTQLRSSLDRNTQGIAIGAVFLLLFAIFSPLHLKSWEFFSPRFTPYGVLLLAALLPIEALTLRGRNIVTVLLFLFGFSATGWAFSYHRMLVERHADVLHAMQTPLRRTGARLTLSLEPAISRRRSEVPFVDPLLHILQLFLLDQGGTGPWAFMNVPQVHELHGLEHDAFPPVPNHRVARAFRDPQTTAERRRTLLDFLAYSGVPFTDVLLLLRPAEADLFLARGYEPTFREGRALIATFRGCPTRLQIIAPDAFPSRTWQVQLGWSSRQEVFSSVTVTTPTTTSVSFSRSPCGGIWLRFQGLPAGWRCAESDASGTLHDSVQPTSATLRCTLTPGATAPSPSPLRSPTLDSAP